MTPEEILHSYRRNAAALSDLNERIRAISSCRVQDYQQRPRGSGVSAPVEGAFIAREPLLAKADALEPLVLPVRRLITSLREDPHEGAELLAVLELRYFQNRSWRDVQDILRVSRSTLWRRGKELLMRFETFLP